MFSLQKLFGKDHEFFNLLESSAEQCHASVVALQRILSNKAGTLTLDELIASRRKGKEINNQITELLSRVSVTALDPEDIEALSNSLYKIPKTVEKFAERYILSFSEIKEIDFSRQSKLLEEATTILVEMLKQLRDQTQVEKLAEQNNLLQTVEGQADELMLVLLKDLYSRKHDPMKVVILKDLYELLEKVVDRCRDAGNVISNIFLKNS